MRILVLGINYAPEVIGIAPCTTALCEGLRQQGHAVEVVTAFPYYPSWQMRPEDRGTFFRSECRQEVRVHRCWLYVPRRPSAVRRMLHEASFTATAFLRALTLRQADLCIVVCPPLALGLAAWLLKVCKGTPYVVHVQDMQPDAAVALGMLRPGLLTSLLYRLESFVYRRARRVSGITRGMVRAFRGKGLPSSKLILMPNSIELPAEEAISRRDEFRKRHGIGADQFFAVYSGNVGAKQGIEVMLEAANSLPEDGVRLAICGDGAGRSLLEGMHENAREKLLLLPLQPRRDYECMLADADCCIITQKAGAGACFFPSKMLSALSYGRAILAVADRDSELTEVIEREGFGVVVPPGDPHALAESLLRMSQDRERVREMGMRGRAYASRFESRRVHAGFEYALREMIAPADPLLGISKLATGG